MKKHSLFKVILIVLGALLAVDGILAILGYFVPALEGKYTMIALGDVLINFVQSFYYFLFNFMLTWKTKNVFPMAWSMRRVSSYRAAISAVNVRQGVS